MVMNQRKGFTLIEILIVVAIIAILASIVLVGLGPTQQSGRDARRLSDLHEIQNGLELYFNKCGGYPGAGTAACGAALPAAAAYPATAGASVYGAVATALNASGVVGTNLPQDPSTGGTYYYAVPSDSALNSTYVLGAKLENSANSAFVNYTPPTVPAKGDPVTCTAAASQYCLSL